MSHEGNLTIKGNEPLIIDDPNLFGIVKSGSVALFSVRLQNQIPSGKRHYLFSIYPQQVLLGMGKQPSRYDDCELGVLVVAMEETKIELISPVELAQQWQSQPATVITWLESWVQQLGVALSQALAELAMKDKPQNSSTYLTSQNNVTHYLTLAAAENQSFSPAPGAVMWVQIQAGEARFLGMEELILTPASGMIPLSENMWLEPIANVEVSLQPSQLIADFSSFKAALTTLHDYSFAIQDFLEQQQAAVEIQRFYERQRLNHQATRVAINELAAILEPQLSEPFAEGADLLRAAGAVGKALGIAIKPPAASENLERVKNPLEAIARASRLRIRRVILTEKWWQRDCGALLGYKGEERCPVALLPMAEAKYVMFDPSQNLRIPINNHIAQQLQPEAYMFYRPLPAKKLQAWDLLKFALAGRKKDLITIFYTGVAISLLGMLIPQATAVVIDTAIPDANRGLIVQIALGLLAASAGAAVLQFIQGLASLRLQTLSDSYTQAAVWDRLLNLRVSFLRNYATGDLQSRVSAISHMRSLLSGGIMPTLLTSFFALLNLGLLFYYSPTMALVALLVAAVTVVFTTASGVLILRQFRPLLELDGQIFGLMVQLINGVAKLRVAGAQERAFAAWAKKYTQQMQLTRHTQFLADNLGVFNTVMPTLTSVVLFWFSWKLHLSDAHFSTGTFLAFYVAFGIFISGATNLSDTVIDILEIVTLWKRAQPILQAQPELDLGKTDPGKLLGKVQLERVNFRYRKDGSLNLDNVTITAQPGEFVALVGPSGSGKSTIFRLLLGFEIPESGTVRYDGQDLCGLDLSAIRRQLGVVLQNGRINSASIWENIAGGAVISLDEAWEAAHLAGFADDIQAMPMGMHTVVSEGATNLSGGQRQRLLIARALVLKPKILLFDEATSALDNRTQAIVSTSLEQLKVTRIVVAHRLSTIRHADCIYVIEAGRVVQQGTFAQLTHIDGLFQQLMVRQMLEDD